MRNHWMSFGCLAIGCVALASFPGRAEDKKNDKNDKAEPRIHVITINQGTRRTVEIVGTGDVSPSWLAAEQDRARAMNEANYVAELQDLKRQYIANERLFAARRHEVQMQQYGNSSTTTNSSSLAYGDGYRGFGYPYWGWSGNGGYPAGILGSLSNSTTTTRDLSMGVGPEGALQTDMARVIASQSTPDFAATASRNFTNSAAVAKAAYEASKSGKPIGVGHETGWKATLTLTNGKEVSGLLLDSDDPDFYMLKDGDNVISIRKSKVDMMKREPAKPKARSGVDD
jgi:hypothetical protein